MNEFNIDEVLQKGIRAARRGRKEPAQQLLNQVVQADPNNEEAWLWLARVVDSPEQQAECLQRVLTINPDNRWAAEQLASLQAGPPAAEPSSAAAEPSPAPPSPSSSEVKLDVLNCPNCGGSVELRGGSDIQTVVCNYCGSVLDLTPEQAAIIGQTDPKVKPARPIELGMEGTFAGKLHQVIGWIRYEGWDDEDRWQWDEWLLASADGEFRWLSYDSEEGFQLYKKITPREPFDPRTATRIQVPGGVARVVERAPARIVALAGELTWQAKVGDQLKYLDAERGNIAYSVEYTREEIELLEGHALSELQVWKAFGREDLAERVRQQTAQRRAELTRMQRKSNTRFYVILAVLIILFILFACICSNCSSSSGGAIGPSVRSGSVSGPSIGGGGPGVGK
jgi:tetratricopeptide (TPR) repeat protein